jgi:hypothetical protein
VFARRTLAPHASAGVETKSWQKTNNFLLRSGLLLGKRDASLDHRESPEI